METFNTVVANLLGNYDAAFYITYFIFVAMGIIISLRAAALSRDKESDRTPDKFSWAFLFTDNAKRALSSAIVVFLSVRLGQEIFKAEPTYVGAVFLGGGIDQAIFWLGQLIKKNKRK